MTFKSVELESLAEFRNGLNFSNASHGSGCKIIGIPDFGDRLTPDYSSLGEINPEGIVKSNDYLQPGDIIFVRSNGNKALVGRSLFINYDQPLVYSGFCIRARFTSEHCNPLFFAYFFRTKNFRDIIAGAAGGANIQNLNQGTLSRSLVPLPSLRIQNRIVSILSAYDGLIENNLKRIKLLEELAQRTFEEWFVKFRVNGEDLVIDGETGLPEGWERKKLKDLVEIVSGYAFKSTSYANDGLYKLVTIKNVQNGRFVPYTTDYLSALPENLKSNQCLDTGDIILSLTGNVGRSCLVYGNNYLLNQRVAKVLSKDLMNVAYVYTFLRNERTIATLENLSNGTAQQNLSPLNLANVEIVIPDMATKQNYSLLINPSIDLICSLNLQNLHLKHSRDILLPRLMNGTINVENADENFALAAEPLEIYNQQS